MNNFNKYATALIAALSFGAAAVVEAPMAKADYLYSDPYSYDNFGNRPTYNQGGYTELDSNDWQRSNIHDSTLKDRDGNLYDCNNIGQCHSRW